MTDYQIYAKRRDELQQELIKWALADRSHIDDREYQAVKAEIQKLKG